MKKLLTMACVAASVALAAPVLAQDKVRWRVPVAFASNLPGLGDPIVYVADTLRTASDGNIQMKVEEPGKIVPPLGIFDALKEGKIDAGYYWIGYDQGKVPSSAIFGAVPFGFEPWEFMTWIYEGGGQELVQEVYAPHNIVPVPCGVIGPETAGWFNKEIKGLDDVKGLKIRFAGVGGKVLQELGASVTMLPGGEIFQALEKGAIDASEFSMPAIDVQLGFNKVAQYNYFPGWHQPFTAQYLMVNKRKWDELSEANQAMIEMACTAAMARAIARGEAVQGEVIRQFRSEGGVKAQTLPMDVLEELRRATNKVLEQEAAADADFKRVLESQREFMRDYQVWKDLAYLPRDFAGIYLFEEQEDTAQ
ncbi:MAG: TRAP transporter substrate-binding protein [Candidatus Competibacteraceae bacterium]|nr:TRAP transporter substrate-binding protein [Candidatus Competibacteraceae bacterium]